ncbi:MAG: ABC transporter permease [Gemmatimonadetes bacterium]|nr:ABC transporter permease [Gemmatimonadota bacterium]
MGYSIREALAAFRRAPGLAALSAASIGFSLFVFGIFALAAYNVRLTLRQAEERVEIVAYLVDDLDAGQLEVLQNEVRAFPEVTEIRFVSKFEAMRNAVRDLPEFRDVFTDLDVNPLPASLEVRLRPEYRDPESVARVAERIALYPFVEEARYGQDWVEKLDRLRRIAGAVASILGTAFALVAVIIIGTTIRIAVFARRDEIAIMQLVGAADGLIRRPFLLEGLLTGLAGGLLALGLSFLAYLAVDRSLIHIAWLPRTWVAAQVAAGAVLGWLSSGAAVRRHLRAL